MEKPSLPCKLISFRKRNNFYIDRGHVRVEMKNRGRIIDLGSVYTAVKEKEKRWKRANSTAATTATARRGKQRGERSVFVKAEQQSNDDGQAATVKNTRTECAVFRTEDKQSDKDPKGYVTLWATIHRNLLCLAAGRMYFGNCYRRVNGRAPAVLSFYYILFYLFVLCVWKKGESVKKSRFSTFFCFYFVA